jgi:sulfonate transport system permease protein
MLERPTDSIPPPKGEGGRPEADRVGGHGLSQPPPTRPPPAQGRRRPPSPFGGGIRKRAWLGRHGPFWLSLVAGMALWEIVGRNTSPAFMVPLSETLVRLWELARSGQLGMQFLDSAALFITGFVVALAVGMPAGLLLARVRALRIGLEPYIMMLYATPMVALIPFILSLMGFGFAPKVLVVFLFAVFPILYNTVEGARSIRPELIEVARSFRSGEWALWREVMLPYTLPFTMTGVRQAIGRGLVGMVAAEFFLSSTGLGALIMTASQNFDTAAVFAIILVIGLIGVALMRFGQAIENRFARWRV